MDQIKIIRICRQKQSVKVFLDNNNVFIISIENYLQNPLIVGNQISSLQIKEIMNSENIISVCQLAYKFMFNKKRSKNEVKEFLFNYKLNRNEIIKLLKKFENQSFINDKELIEMIVNFNLHYLKGRIIIRKKLLKRKLDEKEIEKALKRIDEKIYKENFIKVIDKCNKKYSLNSYAYKREKTKTNLISKGYEKEYICLNIDKYIIYDYIEEFCNVKREIVKISNSYANKDGFIEDTYKIKVKIANKGYKYDIINEVIKEVLDNEIN